MLLTQYLSNVSGLKLFESEKRPKFGNIKANLVEFLVKKGDLLVATQYPN